MELEPVRVSRWRGRVLLAVTLVIAALAGSFALRDPLEIDERAHVRRATLLTVRSIRADLAADMASRILSEARVAQLLAAQPELPDPRSDLISQVFFARDPTEIAVQWIDGRYRLRWTAARTLRDEQLLQETPVVPLIALLQRLAARPNAAATLSRAFLLSDGRRAARVVVPVFTRGVATGFFVAVFDLRAAFESMLIDHRELGYSVSVFEDGEEIYLTPGTTREYEREWAQDLELPLPGTQWSVRLWPERNMVAEIRSTLPELALGVGALLGCLVVISVHFGRSARISATRLRHANDVLEARVQERTAELRHANLDLAAESASHAKAEESLQKLSARLLQLQDEERRRIARELHDSTGQTLGALAIGLDEAQRLAAPAQHERLTTVLRDGVELVANVTQEIRTLSYLLHPPLLDELGLEYVLAWYASGFSTRSGIAVRLDLRPDVGRLPRELELTFFRIAQEALTNVHRHAGSRAVTLTLYRERENVTLEIRDDGRGIPPHVIERMDATAANLGVGIAGMRERVRQFGGRLEIVGGPNGTSVRAVLPSPAAQSPGAGAVQVDRAVYQTLPPTSRAS